MKMLRRKLQYYVRFFLRYYVLGAPAILVDCVLPYLYPFQVEKGIRIMDPLVVTRRHFTELVRNALSLIAASDERLLKRIQREIRTVVNLALPPPQLASYARPLKVCSVDLRCFFNEDPCATTRILAAALVHEATHGVLFSHGVLRTRRNHSRVEGLCCKQAKRFLGRLEAKDSPWDELVVDASVERETFWSRMRQAKELVQEMRGRDLPGEAKTWDSVQSKKKP